MTLRPLPAPVAPLSDADFAAHIARYRDIAEELGNLTPLITSPQRLGLVLDTFGLGAPDGVSHSALSLWAMRFGPSEDLARALLGCLSSEEVICLLCGLPVTWLNSLPHPPSAALVRDILSRRGADVIPIELARTAYFVVTEHDGLLPHWYLNRLLLRVPGLAAVALFIAEATNQYPPSPSLITATAESLITHLSPDVPATLALLTNPAVNLADALSASTALVSA